MTTALIITVALVALAVGLIGAVAGALLATGAIVQKLEEGFADAARTNRRRSRDGDTG